MLMMTRGRRHRLMLFNEPMAICRLSAAESPPAWATESTWWSITRTADELSVVCPDKAVPRDVAASRGWCMLRFEGPLPLDQTGILASVTGPLATAHVSLFALATYDTDYVLVPLAQRGAAIAALEAAGHAIDTPG
jgi:uncharacterized protein